MLLTRQLTRLTKHRTPILIGFVAVAIAGVLIAAITSNASGDNCGSQGVSYGNSPKWDTADHRRKQFGKPGSRLVKTHFMGKKVHVNKRVVACLNKVEKELKKANAHYDVRDVSSYRKINGADSQPWQYHGYGAAIDINPAQNPMCPGYDPNNRCGHNPPYTMPDYWVSTFQKYGFWWGGKYEYSGKDYMHFEFHRF